MIGSRLVTEAVSSRAGQKQFLIMLDNSTRFYDMRKSDSKATKERGEGGGGGGQATGVDN